ncbi:MAG: recombination mediator RecR [Phycisphaerales bacterium]
MPPAYPESVERLIAAFALLPGIGRRSAERLAFHVLKSPTEEATGLARAIVDVKRKVRHCTTCFNLADTDPCPICADPARDASSVLVVEQPKDLIILEQTGMYRGVFHVLLGRIAPLEGVGAESLTVDALIARVRDPRRNSRGVAVREVILGLNPDLEGDTTALHLAERIAPLGVKVTRLARGIPSGSQLEYANKAVLADAIEGRTKL